MRKLVVALVVFAVVVPAAALAGGWATVGLSSTPKGSVAGKPWVVNLTVLQHGVTPLDGIQPHVRITQGTLARQFLARPTAKIGRLQGTRRLPARGHVALVDLGRLQPNAHLQGGACPLTSSGGVSASMHGDGRNPRSARFLPAAPTLHTASECRRSPRLWSTFVAIDGICSSRSERAVGHDEQPHRRGGGDRRRARDIRDEGDLADEVAGAELAERLPAAGDSHAARRRRR